MTLYFSGIATACFIIGALFFLKFYRASHDRFFMFLSFSFFLLSVERVVGALTYVMLPADEITRGHTRSYLYLIRFLAFIVILISIFDKNRASNRSNISKLKSDRIPPA